MARESDNAQMLRNEIDHGQAADKVDYPDPAASPLGTDDEAGGHPVTPTQARMAHAEEVARPGYELGHRDLHRPGAELSNATHDAHEGDGLPQSNTFRLLLPVALMVVAVLLVVWVFV